MKKKSTPLWIAAWNGHVEIVQYLIHQGADPTIQNDLRKDAFWVTEQGDSKVSQEIREKMKDIMMIKIDTVLISEPAITRGDEIGRGSLSTVYKGEWNSTTVAIKEILNFGDKELVREEIRILKELRHPRIVLVMGVCVTETKCSIVLEYMEGPTLFDRIRDEEKPFTTKDLIERAREIAEGMSYLHNMNVVHGDLKSKNIILGTGGAKIGDFGLFRITKSTQSSMTIQGDVCNFGDILREMAANSISSEEAIVPPNSYETLLNIVSKCCGETPITFPEILQQLPEIMGVKCTIMISYVIRESQSFVEKLKIALEKVGCKVFVGESDLIGGDNWPDVLYSNIVNCDVFIPIITPSYGDTFWTKKELQLAENKRKMFIPLMYSQIETQDSYLSYPTNSVELHLTGCQWINFTGTLTNEESFNSKLSKLMAKLIMLIKQQ